MASEPRSARLAVLIDADNASARIAGRLFDEIAKIGEASVRRIYGDFSSTRLKSWADILSKHAIIPHQNFAYTTGKNASDIALVIDAMDLLHSGRFDGFCLVSSDSDFTRLAARIREQGIDVYGFGEQKTPESFRQACRRFIYTENLLPEAPAPDRDRPPDAKPLQPPSAALPLLRKAIAQLDDEDGWVGLGGVGQRLVTSPRISTRAPTAMRSWATWCERREPSRSIARSSAPGASVSSPPRNGEPPRRTSSADDGHAVDPRRAGRERTTCLRVAEQADYDRSSRIPDLSAMSQEVISELAPNGVLRAGINLGNFLVSGRARRVSPRAWHPTSLARSRPAWAWGSPTCRSRGRASSRMRRDRTFGTSA